MARGYQVGIGSETKAFKRGIETGVIEPLEDAQKELLDLGRSRGADQLEDSLRDAQRATDRLDDEIQDTRQSLERLGRSARDAGDDAKRGMKDAEGGVRDFKDESNSTAREAAASFDGSAESIADAFQEVAANAFAGFGPAGAVAGLAAAAGIGLAAAGFTAADEARQASEEAIADWADAFVEAGNRALSAGIVAARFQEIITDPERFKTAEKNAKDWGVSIETAVAAMSGDAGAVADVTAAVKLLGDQLADTMGSEAAIDAAGNVNTKLYEQEQAYRTAADSLGKLTGEMDAGAQRAALLDRYYRDLVNSAESATKEVDELGNAVYTLPDGTQIMIDAETGRATQNLDRFKGDLDGVPETVTSTVKVAVDSSAWDRWTPRRKDGWVNARVNQPI